MEEFAACFSELTDPRQDNARHDLHEILMIALCTMLCGGEDCSDMPLFGQAKEAFLRQFLTLKHGIPSHDTFSRVFRLLDPVAFAACFTRFRRRGVDVLGHRAEASAGLGDPLHDVQHDTSSQGAHSESTHQPMTRVSCT
jgi:hypothetical protein